MLNETDRNLFADALAELGVRLHPVFVNGHSNTLQGFIEEWGQPKRLYRASNGILVNVWQGLKQHKRAPTSDVYAADFGDERAFHVVVHAFKAA